MRSMDETGKDKCERNRKTGAAHATPGLAALAGMISCVGSNHGRRASLVAQEVGPPRRVHRASSQA